MSAADSNPVPTSEKRIFTTGEAAELCKVSQQTIIRCFDAGRLGGFRVPGSKFRRIPREELIRFMRANGIPTEVIEGGARKRLLIVDDDPQIVEVFTDLLRRDTRFEVRSATSGYEAGMLTESFRPHAIILDYMLPDINGSVVCRRIRERPELSGTKVVFISGAVAPGEVDQLMSAGADEFIKKPFSADQVVKRIAELLAMGPETGMGAAALRA
jgi:excisionase family DNA binding protein